MCFFPHKIQKQPSQPQGRKGQLELLKQEEKEISGYQNVVFFSLPPSLFSSQKFKHTYWRNIYCWTYALRRRYRYWKGKEISPLPDQNTRTNAHPTHTSVRVLLDNSQRRSIDSPCWHIVVKFIFANTSAGLLSLAEKTLQRKGVTTTVQYVRGQCVCSAPSLEKGVIREGPKMKGMLGTWQCLENVTLMHFI